MTTQHWLTVEQAAERLGMTHTGLSERIRRAVVPERGSLELFPTVFVFRTGRGYRVRFRIPDGAP
jgi:hypothetical protein